MTVTMAITVTALPTLDKLLYLGQKVTQLFIRSVLALHSYKVSIPTHL